MTTSQRTGLTGDVEQLLEAVSAGRLDVAAALEQLAQLPFRDLGFARVDTHRELRQGAPEAVLAEGKTHEEVAQIVARAARRRCRQHPGDTRRRGDAGGRPDRSATAGRSTSERAAPGSRARCRRGSRARRDRVGRHLRRAGGARGAHPRRAAGHARSPCTRTPASPDSTASRPHCPTCSTPTA